MLLKRIFLFKNHIENTRDGIIKNNYQKTSKALAFLSCVIFFVFLPVGYSGFRKVEAATYYVDATGGLDANSGTSSGAAWQTVAKVNISTFSAGDSILFKKGEVWREQLVVPSSGTVGQPITFGSYGSGNKPKILGSKKLINPSPFKPNVDFYGGWEWGLNSSEGILEGEGTGEHLSSGGSAATPGPNMGWSTQSGAISIIDSSDVSMTDGSRYALKADHNSNFQKNLPSATPEITTEFIFRYTANPSDYTFKLLTSANGNVADVNIASIPTGKIKIYNYATSAIVAQGNNSVSINTWYRIQIHYKVDGSAGVASWTADSWNGSQWQAFDSGSATSLNTGIINIGKVRFMARQGTTGNYCYFDEVYMNAGNNPITSTTRASSNNILVYYNALNAVPWHGYFDYKMRRVSTGPADSFSTLGEDLASQKQLYFTANVPKQAYVSLPSLSALPTVEIDQKGTTNTAIVSTNKSYVSLDGLFIGQSALYNIWITGGNNVIVTNCDIYGNHGHSFYLVSSDAFQITHNNITGYANQGIKVSTDSSVEDNAFASIHSGDISNNYLNQGFVAGSDGVSWKFVGNDMNGIVVKGDSAGTYVTDNVTVKNNTVENCGNAGLFNHYNATNITWAYNVVRNVKLDDTVMDQAAFVIRNHLSGTSAIDVNVYNNTFWNDMAVPNKKYVIYMASNNGGVGTMNVNIKNNIINSVYDDVTNAGFGMAANISCPLTINKSYNLFYLSRAEQLIFGAPNNYVTVIDGGNNLANSTNPRFIDSTSGDFRFQYISPAIETGVAITGLITDYLGNHIYGTPDIGAYEYQPPYTITTDNPNISSPIRIYADGKYRYTNTTSGSTNAKLSITPQAGFGTGDYSEWMDVAIDTWHTSADYYKKWTEASANHALVTTNTIGDLKPNTYYTLEIDTDNQDTYLSNSSGQITFTYSGGYSTHTFEITEDTTAPASFTLVSPANNTVTSNRIPTFSWNASSDTESNLYKYQLYIDGIMDVNNIASSATSSFPSTELSCGNHSWYIKAIDNNNNSTNSDTFNLDINCAGGLILPPKPIITLTDPALGTVPTNITQIAISTTPDFTNISWQPFDKDKFKNIDQTSETLYVKFRTDQGAVSDVIIYIPQVANQDTAITLSEGDIVKTPNNPDVYVIKYKNSKQYKRLILSPLVFQSYQHLKWENIKTVSQNQLDKYTTSNLVKETIDTITYQLFPNGDTGERKALDNSISYDFDSIYEINVTDRDMYKLVK